MSIEAMKQALDVIETYSPEYMHGLPKKHYTKALHQAIEEAEKREWVGLTEQDVGDALMFVESVKQLRYETDQPEWGENFAGYLEAKLKDKNT